MKLFKILIFYLILVSCNDASRNKNAQIEESISSSSINETFLLVLGTIQDAGSPHIACTKDCCRKLFIKQDRDRKVVSLGIIDPENNKKYIFEATPDLTEQMKTLKKYASFNEKETPDGIFLTHAHIGHYTGLMYLGKEAMNAANIPVYAMPRMKAFLEENGPWSQLVVNSNIAIQEMSHKKEIQLTPNVRVIPFLVPHRDEYSETVGYTIIGPNKKVLFIPDIDKWDKWETDIIEAISKVDYAFIDGTFYDAEEINNRDISEIPHPFIIESINAFKGLPAEEKGKIYFIHFNHTNPALNPKSDQAQKIINNGFNIATIYDTIKL
ncbi:MAG: pyrroloquinoline quinone biosynthesis protein PqqB [Flavobacteriales bacterium]|nr:MAG: pyrroloquinoline quinone biosynthesis protein PqqB [Flavobacteriales bacterium]